MGTPLYPQNNNQDEDAKLKCKYLKWADEEENPPCNYCRESAKRQAKTGDNAGREFYCWHVQGKVCHPYACTDQPGVAMQFDGVVDDVWILSKLSNQSWDTL